MRTYFLLAVLVSFYQVSVAQKDGFNAGLYVNQQNDTVKGFISVIPNSRFFKFKPEQSYSSSNNILIDSARLVIAAEEKYVVWYGKRNVTWVDQIEHEIKNIDSFRTEYILLKQEYAGKKFSLYSYKDETDRFFIGYDSKVEELIMKYRYFTGKEHNANVLQPNMPKYTVFPVFRDQMIAIMQSQVSNKQRHMIELTEYNRQNLIKMIKSLDGK